MWAANYGALEWHAWTRSLPTHGSPTYALIDIDPGTATSWDDVLVLARLHRTALEHLGVRGQPKVTGPARDPDLDPVRAGLTYQDTRSGSSSFRRRSARRARPGQLEMGRRRTSAAWRASTTPRTCSNKTLVAPYSPRAEPGAPVSAPIDWDELDDPALRPDGFTIRTVLDRVR